MEVWNHDYPPHFLEIYRRYRIDVVRVNRFGVLKALAQIPGGTLDPSAVPKFGTPLLIPPVMPKARTIVQRGGKNVDYYEISMEQFTQQILPARIARHNCVGIWCSVVSTRKGTAHSPCAIAYNRGQVEHACTREVDQRSQRCKRQLSTSPAAGRSDLALGQPSRRHDRPRHAPRFHW